MSGNDVYRVVGNLLGNDPTHVSNPQLAAEVGKLIAERFTGLRPII